MSNNAIEFIYYPSLYGELIIGTYNNKLCVCDWRYRKMRSAIDARITKALGVAYIENENKLITETIQQLEEYFNGKRTTFNLPILLVGTAFQQQVWTALQQIPYGTTVSYMQQAITLQNKQAVRAVATANGANAIAIIVPCHRIIGSNGNLVGYAGGLTVKAKLLALENPNATAKGEQQQLLF